METRTAVTQIKSFKHDGHLHRVWLENWQVPCESLISEHREENMQVYVNCQTKIREADGREWISKIPGISFFIPHKWFNVVALIEEEGVRYYCNIASPFYKNGNVVTYIDYDLDVIMSSRGEVHLLDEDEYNKHRRMYHYSSVVEEKVKSGLEELQLRIRRRKAPFHEESVRRYYELWKQSEGQTDHKATTDRGC